ncbi:hypothetical protein CISG_08060 [Coccidioides immitis RMSCC 3703]|uniref:Uncharacterized protein n=1 Tax=Coccidioides immitis RMSCC 3703 TaxID=454286 RepID=A0A0J8R5T1_COCIT|nr:hypothetical protein CISG_08060 [Coccidioides immitis RMSCC 3703]
MFAASLQTIEATGLFRVIYSVHQRLSRSDTPPNPTSLPLDTFEIVAFPTSKYLSNTFPNADPQVLQNLKSVLLGGSLPNPEVHALVAVDPSTNQTVAYCRWTIPTAYGYGDAPRAEISCQAAARAAKALEYGPESTNKEIYDMFASLLKAKQKVHTREDDMSMSNSLPAIRCTQSCVSSRFCQIEPADF